MSLRNREQDIEWNQIIGSRILERRESLGKTQKWLSNKADVSLTVIWTLEAGKACPYSHTLYRIARALSCDMGFFYAPIRTAESATF